jgi:hypothetical protein
MCTTARRLTPLALFGVLGQIEALGVELLELRQIRGETRIA